MRINHKDANPSILVLELIEFKAGEGVIAKQGRGRLHPKHAP